MGSKIICDYVACVLSITHYVFCFFLEICSYKKIKNKNVFLLSAILIFLGNKKVFRNVFVSLNSKFIYFLRRGVIIKKNYTYASRAALAQVRLSPLPGGVSLGGVCHTNTAATARAAG